MAARAQDVARNLLLLRAPSAEVIEGTTTRTLPIGAVVPGMRVAVAAEARFPVDGRVIDGAGTVDDSVITGESVARAVARGDRVHAGTLNLSTPLVVEVTAADDASLLAGIVEMMAAAEQAKAGYVGSPTDWPAIMCRWSMAWRRSPGSVGCSPGPIGTAR